MTTRTKRKRTGGRIQPSANPQRQVNEWGYYRPDASEFDHINHGPDAVRGLRNRNPANLRDTGDVWNGMTGVDGQRFIQFEIDHDGIRAAARSMNIQSQRGVNTVRQITHQNSFAADNNPEPEYREYMARRLGVGLNDQLDLNDPEPLASLTQAVIEFELGEAPYTREQYMNAVRDALHRE